jgi:hypothetical protein
VQKFPEFVAKWRQRPTEMNAARPLIFMYGSNMRTANLHNNYPVPNILWVAQWKSELGGQQILLPERTPLANLHLTVLQKAGIERDKSPTAPARYRG